MAKSQKPIKPRQKKTINKAIIPEIVSPAFTQALKAVAELDQKDKTKH